MCSLDLRHTLAGTDIRRGYCGGGLRTAVAGLSSDGPRRTPGPKPEARALLRRPVRTGLGLWGVGREEEPDPRGPERKSHPLAAPGDLELLG